MNLITLIVHTHFYIQLECSAYLFVDALIYKFVVSLNISLSFIRVFHPFLIINVIVQDERNKFE